MEILRFHPTDEVSLNWFVLEAGQTPSDFIPLGPNSPNGRALHRRLPPPGGQIHLTVDDDLAILLRFSDAEWPLICAAASIAPPPGAVPVELQQSREESCLTTPKVSFTHGTERSFRRFVNHPVLAHDTIVGNASYPDTVWHHYILTLGNLIWAEVIVIYQLGDDPYAIDDPCSDEQNWELPFVGKWVGGYLDVLELLGWFVTHAQQPPQTLIADLLEFAVLKVRRLPPITTPIHGQPPVAGPSQADPMPPPSTEETLPKANAEVPDGPFGRASLDIDRHERRSPETLITDPLEFAALEARQSPPITTPIHGQPPVADSTQADPMPPLHVEETAPAANEDISAGHLGGGSPDIELTVAQVAQWVRLEPNSMSGYRKEWGQPAVPHSGRRPARYLLSAIISILKRQFLHIKDWTDIGRK